MAVKHTKGPWHVSHNISEHVALGIRSRHGDFLCLGTHVRPPSSKMLANYHLAATAPQLLEALQEVYNNWQRQCVVNYTTADTDVLRIDKQVKAAIAAAEKG